MANLFDGLRKNMVDTVNTVFGHICTWVNSQSSPAETEQQKVLYNSPDQTQKKYGFGQTFGGGKSLEFEPAHPSIEYKAEYFIMLKQNVDDGIFEYVNIKEIGSDGPGQDYFVRKVEKKHDGNTVLAILELKNN